MYDEVLETVDDLTVNYEENGIQVIKELNKAILSTGAWVTILFHYKEWKPDIDDYGPDKFVINRYKKVAGQYKKQSKFNISSIKQARKIIDVLSEWTSENN